MVYEAFIISALVKDKISFSLLVLWVLFAAFVVPSRTILKIKKFFKDSGEILSGQCLRTDDRNKNFPKV